MNTRLSRPLALALLALSVTACGVEITAGGGRDGEVEAVVTTDGGSSSEMGPHTPLFSTESTGASGTISTDARVTLVSQHGFEVRLSPGPVGGTFSLAGGDSARIGAAQVETGRYTRAHITFTRVQAQVASGFPVLGAVAVDLNPTAPLTVEVPIDLRVTAGSRGTVVVDVNAHLWLGTASPVTRLVTRSAFASAVEVRIR